MNRFTVLHTGKRPLILLTAMWLLLAVSCKQVSRLVPVVPDRTTDQVITSMHAAQPAFEYFSARFSGSAGLFGEQNNIAGSIHIRKDSAIFISVAPVLGIEVARILITPQSVRVLNRLEGTYFDGDMQLINNMLNADLDFLMLQSLLLGTDFPHFSAENFRLSHDQDHLKLNSTLRRRLRSPSGEASAISHGLWLDPHSFRIWQSHFTENINGRFIQASYPRYTTIEALTFPSEVLITVSDDATSAELLIRYSRIMLDQPQQFSFSIPPRYRPMDF